MSDDNSPIRDNGTLVFTAQVLLVVGLAAVISTWQYYLFGTVCSISHKPMLTWFTDVDINLAEDRDCRRIGLTVLIGGFSALVGTMVLFYDKIGKSTKS